MKLFIKDFFSKCDQIQKKLRIWSYLLKKSSMKNCSGDYKILSVDISKIGEK